MIGRSLVCCVLFWSAQASARRVPLEAQIRAHGGLSLVNKDINPGATLGLDTRLTRLLYMDVGGFASLVETLGDAAPDEPSDAFSLRHAIYVTPGVRVPHRYGEGWNWDVIGRVGFGAVWAHDAASNNESAAVYTDPALAAGGDFVVRRESVGVRISGRGFWWQSFSALTNEDIGLVRPQASLEFLYQW